MRTLLCPACLSFLTAWPCDAHDAMRQHAVDSTHPLSRMVDVEATFWGIARLSYGVRA